MPVPEEMDDIILYQNSLNVSTLVATQSEIHTNTHFGRDLHFVYPEICFCAHNPQQQNLFPFD